MALDRICLDTSAYSHFKRGDAAAVEPIRSARVIGVPAVVLGELRTGFRLGRHASANEAGLVEFLMHPVVDVLDVDADVATRYAEIVVELRRRGTPVPTNDIWIAAAAARHGLTVLSYDTHFRAMPFVGALVLGRP